MTCPSCGVHAPDDARFCPSCGHPLHARGDERRVATVLFADLVGFTTLSEARDPESVKNLVERCFERLANDVVAFGGRVDKVVGDALVALFGAPIAHEDDAERAVRAALEMHHSLAAHAVEQGVDVQMRIGVNTGEVLVGAIRAGDDYTAMGDVVNVASRLEVAAGPGEVLVGPETHAATRDVIRYDEVGPLEVRGRDEPVRAWRALGAIARPGRRPRRSRTPLVGRSAEMGMLQHAFRAAVTHRRAHVVLLTGDAGVGKSRLAEELSCLATTEYGAFLLEGHCVPYGEANVWFPVAEALQQACAITADDSVEAAERKSRVAVSTALGKGADPTEIDRVTGGLLYLMGFEHPLGGVDPTRARDEALVALLTAFRGVARERPVVIVLSDIHWADDRVLELIDRLVPRMAHEPLLLVATARTDLGERWWPSPGRHNLMHLNLDPLPPTASADLLNHLLSPDASPEVRTLLIERSGGNPFYLEELVALIGESGGLGLEAVAAAASADTHGHTHSTSPLGGLPATLRGLVAARIDALSPGERGILEDAAVVGRTGGLETLAALAAARGDADRSAVVSELVAKDLLVVLGGEYGFKTDLVREVAYSTLTKTERARRHALVGALLEERAQSSGREDEHLDSVAHHYGTAAELADEVGGVDGLSPRFRDKAVLYLARAAVRAEKQDEPLATIHHLDHVLRLLPANETAHRWKALLGRAKARSMLHQHAAAHEDVSAALAEATAAGDERYVAAAATVLGEVLSRENHGDEAAAALADAVTRWKALGDDEGYATALRLQGFNQLMRGELVDAERSIREALERFSELGDRGGEAWAMQNLAWISFLRGYAEEAEGRLEQAAATFTELGDLGGEGWARGLMAFVRFQQGRYEEAEELARRVLPPALDRSEKWAAGMMEVLLAQIQLWRGEAIEAVEQAQAALKLFVEINDEYGEVQALNPVVRGLLATGRIGEAHQLLDRQIALARRNPGTALFADSLAAGVAVYLGDTAVTAPLLAGFTPEQIAGVGIGGGELAVSVGFALLQVGRADEAMAVLDAVHAEKPSQGLAANLAGALLLAYAAAGRYEEARALAADIDVTHATYLDRVRIATGLGLVETRAGRGTEARAHFDHAVALADATDDVVAQALARLAYGQALFALGTAEAAGVLADARNRLALIDVNTNGWATAFAVALAAAPEERA